MIKYCLLILSLILPMASTLTTPESMETFNDVIFENYDSYGYLLVADKKDYEVMVINGVIGNDTYYGIFINNKTNTVMQAFLETKNINYEIKFNDHIANYPKLKMKKNSTYTFKIIDTISEKAIYEETFITNGQALSDVFNGLGNHQLSTEKLSIYFKPLPAIQIVSTILIVVFGLIIIFIVAFKKNRNIRYHNLRHIPVQPNRVSNVIDVIDDDYELSEFDNFEDNFQTSIEVQKENKDSNAEIILDKQAYMNHLFKLYEHNEITEEELNEEIKKIWWKND